MRVSASASYDVLVVGAGPAGSATALSLARAGASVALVERTHFEAPRVGESLAPNVREALVQLGVWREFMALAPLPSWGTRSVWGGEGAEAHSHFATPYGSGWHVDRRRFDQMLAQAAVNAGAVLREGFAVRRAESCDGAWAVRLEAPDVIYARALVDATGRSAHLSRALGGKRVVFDHLVGVAARCNVVDAQQLGYLLVEAVPQGWWYTAPLPLAGGAKMIAMLMTDADLCADGRFGSPERFASCLSAAAETRTRLSPSWSDVRVCGAQSQRLVRDTHTAPWLAVGDASLAVDPISGSGVLRALRSAQDAAAVLLEALAQPESCSQQLQEYERARDEECSRYLFERAEYYALEQRFDTPFWRRRRVLCERR